HSPRPITFPSPTLQTITTASVFAPRAIRKVPAVGKCSTPIFMLRCISAPRCTRSTATLLHCYEHGRKQFPKVARRFKYGLMSQGILMQQDVNAGRNGSAEQALFDLSGDAGEVSCSLAGDWTTHTVGAVDRQFRGLEANNNVSHLRLDLAGIRYIDTAGAWLVARLIHQLEKRGTTVEVVGQSDAAQILLSAVAETADEPDLPVDESRRFNPLALFEA